MGEYEERHQEQELASATGNGHRKRDPAKSVLLDRPARPFCRQNCACKSSECWPCNGPAVREQRIMSSGAGLSEQTLALSTGTGRKHREHAHGRARGEAS